MALAISAMVPTGDAVALGRTYVAHDCRHGTIRPRYILFTCADGGFYMTQGEWTSWHRWRAAGTALFHMNDCDPSCAEGTFHTMRGRVVLHRRERCPGLHRHHHVFTRATITFDGRLLGHHRARAFPYCPA